MPIHPWPHLLKRLKKGQRLLGLDVGTKTIGIAIGIPQEKIASPLLTLTRKKVSDDLAGLAALARDHQIGGFVIGLALNMNGSEGASARRCRLLATQMLEHKKLFEGEPQISFFDERLSTAAMEDFLNEHTHLRRAARDTIIDKLAAAAILKAAFEARGP